MNFIVLSMNIIPLISIKKGRLCDGKDGDYISIDELFKRLEKDAILYVLDQDGIQHNSPSLDMYQKLTEHCILWIDGGPRRLDDVMDIIMAGATNITLREELWPELDIARIFELTDDEVYLCIDSIYGKQSPTPQFSQKDIGVVLFNQELQILDDFTFTSLIKDTAVKHKTYLYTISQNSIVYLEGLGITGLLVDLNKKQSD